MKKPVLYLTALFTFLSFNTLTAQNEEYIWAWIGGTQDSNTSVFGTKGVSDPANIPGAGHSTMYTTDPEGNFWLYGSGSGSSVLWKYDGTGWTWVAGTSRDITGSGFYPDPVYGTKGVADPANRPSVRRGGRIVADSQGNIWLFGGIGEDGDGDLNSYLNDLWKFDGTNWTWVSGASQGAQFGVYGTKGEADPGNVPGSREGHVMWADDEDNIWVFGGDGWATTTPNGGVANRLNDLWKFDGTNWSWVAGSNGYFQQGIFGTKGVADPSNTPGARYDASGWYGDDGFLYLFGGRSHGQLSATGTTSSLSQINDLWKFDTDQNNWTWIKGADTLKSLGVYGTQGIAGAENTPSARTDHTVTKLSNGDVIIFGGNGIENSSGSFGNLSDVWRFDGTNWVWQSGPNTVNEEPDYGTLDVPANTNTPGGRYEAAIWANGDDVYLFSGTPPNSSSFSLANDFWKYSFEVIVSEENWFSTITTDMLGKSSSAELGVNPDATNGFDEDTDLPLPPDPIGDYMQLYFDHPEFGGELGDKYYSDYKAFSDYNTSNTDWELSLYSTISGSDTLEIHIPEGLEIPIKVIDESGNEFISTDGTDLEVIYTISSEQTLTFNIVVGDITPPEITLGESMDGPQIWDVTKSRTLTWSAADPSGISSMSVEVSYDGGENWTEIYSGTDTSVDFIPVAGITFNEQTYFRVTATDNASEDFANTGTLTGSKLITLAAPTQTLQYEEGWQIAGSPLIIDPENNVPSEAVRYRWNTTSSEYIVTDTYPATEGVWLGAYTSGSDQLSGTVRESDTTITLNAGWNLTSIPLFRNVETDSVTVGDGTVTWSYDDALNSNLLTLPFEYDGSGYVTVTEMQVYKGYWIGVTNGSLEVTLPIHELSPAAKQLETESENQVLLTVSDGTREQLLELVFDEGISSPAPPAAPDSYNIGLEGESTNLGHLYLTYYLTEEEVMEGRIPLAIEGPEREITLAWEVMGFVDTPIALESSEDELLFLEESGEIEISSSEANNMLIAFGGAVVDIEPETGLPTEFKLQQNYPNPFNPSTVISYQLPVNSEVSLKIFDMVGREVAELAKGQKAAGNHTAHFDASNLSSGMYIYRLQAGSFTQTRKLMLIK